MKFTVEHTPANIVKVFPKASDLFKEYKIDFCCGGNRPLEESFTEKNLDSELILDKLNTTYEEWSKEDHDLIDWDAKSLSELVDHITHKHHAYLMEELPALGQFVTKVYSRHGASHPELKELYRLYNEFKLEMEEHTIKENNEVFPLIKEYDVNPSEELLEKIRVANGGLEDEHNAVGDLLKEMRTITGDFLPPANACGSYQITYARLAELEEDTFQHIHLENNILFARL
ncbi:iron-sulfur cluster repair di-iron protein [Oceanobacillus sp. Castelsardo]|uniref:iron-sulfur cluster repair di-iron protein n=1 Tax=Oceanobacillus sp. Castelsardo TaxID=1851204 RepID=UPI000A8B0D80|nr:iron-sulfur cluster repair di-iron protein [Oceanobacillus sp. Castelsardo]